MPSETQLLRALGKKVRELRTARKWSQERLAEVADIHENHVRRIELGQSNPTYLLLVRLAKALSVTPAELFRAS